MLSQSVEDFLKAVYELQLKSEDGWVGTNALAEHLGHTAAAVTNRVKKLSAKKTGLIEYKPYQGVRLKKAGRQVALELVRHHRLIELYLAEALGVPWDKVHDEAERLEHVISEDLEDRMAEALGGTPTYDPHGSPIPTREGFIPERDSQPLNKVEAGTSVVVVEVSDHDAELLRYLGEAGLYPQTKIKVLGREPFGGSLSILIKGKTISLGEEAAKHIAVV